MKFQAYPVRIRCGSTVLVPNQLAVLTSYILLEQESWFEDEFEFVSSLLRPGECAIDIGANFGVYVVAMAEAVGPGGKIFAFEPATETSAYLRATVRLKYSAQVEVIQAAVSDRNGRAHLRIAPSPELNALSEPGEEKTRSEPVEVATLDDRLAKRCATIAFIKIDAEGHELAVGQGARKLILEDDPLIMFEIKHGKLIDLRFLGFLENLGFAPYRLATGLGLLVPFERTEPIDSRTLNLFACSPKRAAHLHDRGLLARRTRLLDEPLTAQADAGAVPISVRALRHLAPLTASYKACLDHFHCAIQKNLDPDLRFSHLRQSLQLGRAAVAERNTLARNLALARICTAFGNHGSAVTMLQKMEDDLMKLATPVFDETCLGFGDSKSVGVETASAGDVLRVEALEALERWRSYSTYVAGTKSLPLLDYLCQQPRCPPEMHRRRQLVRMCHQLQTGPEPHPSLLIDSQDNLNPWFWRG